MLAQGTGDEPVAFRATEATAAVYGVYAHDLRGNLESKHKASWKLVHLCPFAS